MLKRMKAIWAHVSGATAIEYALIAAFIALVAIVGMKSIGNNVSKPYNSVAENLQ